MKMEMKMWPNGEVSNKTVCWCCVGWVGSIKLGITWVKIFLTSLDQCPALLRLGFGVGCFWSILYLMNRSIFRWTLTRGNPDKIRVPPLQESNPTTFQLLFRMLYDLRAISFCQNWPARPNNLQRKCNNLKEHLHDDPSHSSGGVYHPRSVLIWMLVELVLPNAQSGRSVLSNGNRPKL